MPAARAPLRRCPRNRPSLSAQAPGRGAAREHVAGAGVGFEREGDGTEPTVPGAPLSRITAASARAIRRTGLQFDNPRRRAENHGGSIPAARTPLSVVLLFGRLRTLPRCSVPASGQSEAIQQAQWETEQLFERHSLGLMRYLRSGVRNITDIEDIAQETFVRYFQERCNGASIDNPKGWLYRVGRHLALDHAKKARPVLLDESGWRAIEAEHAYKPASDSDAAVSSLPWHLLSETEKECLLLRAEGFKFREIAEVLDVSISTVASYVARAIKKLRQSASKPSETPDDRRAPSLR